jgi:hypothetical protein
LTVALGISSTATVAGRDPQKAVRSEGDVTAIVVRKRLLDGQDDCLGRRLRPIGIAFGACVLRDHRVSGEVGVVDEKPSVAGVVRVERQTEKTLLVGRISNPISDVEERCRTQAAIIGDSKSSGLLDNEQAPAAIAGGAYGHWPLQSGDDRFERD